MFCSRCGAPVVPNSAFCSSCGAPTGIGVERGDALRRPGIVTLLAVLQFIGAALLLVAAAIGLGAVAMNGDGERGMAIVVSVLVGGLGGLQLACGLGLWKLRPYGRTLQLAFAFIGLLGVPLGTMISIFILVYLFKPGIKALFSGKTVAELTPAELAEIAAATQGSQLATVLIVVVVLFVGIAMLGIMAAIAIPSLLRARLAANEAVAIGSIRFINSAEVSYAAAAGKGGYAVKLATLSAPCPGTSQPFISPDLAQDPSTKSGYVFALESAGVPTGATDCNGVPTKTDYYATAVPVTIGSTGLRAFSTSATSTIFFDPGGTAPTRAATLAGTARPVE